MKNLKSNSRTKEQLERMEIVEKLNVCPFCEEGLEKIHKLPIEKETINFFVTKNAFPYEGTSHHYLIIPKKHIREVLEISPKMWAEIGELFNWIVESIPMKFGGVFLRFGDLHRSAASLEHLHFQILSGTKSDKDKDKKSVKATLGYK